MTAKINLISIATIALFGALAIAPASADDNGVGYMHAISKEGGKSCFSDHFHYSTGSGATKAAAMRDAVVSWQNFTAFEYGSDWARWSKANSKGGGCTKSGGGVSCSIEGRPCK